VVIETHIDRFRDPSLTEWNIIEKLCHRLAILLPNHDAKTEQAEEKHRQSSRHGNGGHLFEEGNGKAGRAEIRFELQTGVTTNQ
jgi:hypothetical protein